jgi:hypothetical protein
VSLSRAGYATGTKLDEGTDRAVFQVRVEYAGAVRVGVQGTHRKAQAPSYELSLEFGVEAEQGYRSARDEQHQLRAPITRRRFDHAGCQSPTRLLLVRLQDYEHDPGMHAETATVLGRRVHGPSGEGDGEGLDQVGVRVGTSHDEEGLWESFGEVRESV